ncbi:MAG: SelB C-terminal domain-containing protein, partial [Pseudomonadota bacterium]
VTRNKGAHVNMLTACQMHDLNATAHALAARDQGVVDLQTLARISAGDEISLGEDFEMVSSKHALRRIEILSRETNLLDALTELHAAHPCRPLIDREDLFRSLRPAPAILIEAAINRNSATQLIHVDKTGIALAHRDPFDNMTRDQRTAYQAADDRLKEMELKPVALFQSPGPEQLDLEALLIWKSRAVRLYNHSLKQTLLLSTDAIAAAEQTLKTAFPDAKTFTTGAARDALKTNRKTIVPLLEYFDARGVTEREGDERIIVV